jgi:hypothetical protein
MATTNQPPGRARRGLNHHLCFQCISGIVPGQVKTFDPTCEGCQKKLADGLRTGLEPRPVSKGSRNGMANVGSGYNPARAARKNLQQAGRRAYRDRADDESQ